MPVEIRELVIRATVVENQGVKHSTSTRSPQQSETLKAEKIAAQISEIMRKKKER